MTMQEKLKALAAAMERDKCEYLRRAGLDCQGNLDNAKAKIKPGIKYTKVDIGGSGKYMVENSTGIICGIKAYGVIHRGHQYGTLDTIDQWYWGGYTASKKHN